MALGVQVQIADADAIRAAFRRAPEQTMRRWDRTLTRHLNKGVRIIQTDYRNGPTTTRMRTKVVTGNLKSSYGVEVTRRGHTITGEMGGMRKFERGNALVYMPTHEFGAQRNGHMVPARPPEGAIEATRKRIQPEMIEALRRDVVEALKR